MSFFIQLRKLPRITPPPVVLGIRQGLHSSASFAFRSSLVNFDKKEEQGRQYSHSQTHVTHSHSHSHSHSHHDSVFLVEKGGLKNPALRITWIGLLVNVGIAVGKGVGGVVFHSQALLADSVHALSDLVSDFLTLATVTLGSRPISATYPFGYGRYETLGSLGVSSLLIMAGVSMGWSGLFSVLHEIAGDAEWLHSVQSIFGDGHSHSHDGTVHTNINAAWLALASIAIKEWLYFATMRVAVKTASNVLVANAWHHRIDSLVSMVAVATIAGGYFLGITWLDPLGGLIVSSIIVRAGWSSAKSSILELADNVSGVPAEEVEKFKQMAEDILQEATTIDTHLSAFQIKSVEIVPSGPNLWSNIVLSSDSSRSSTTASLQRISKLLTTKILDKEPRYKRVNVFIEY